MTFISHLLLVKSRSLSPRLSPSPGRYLKGLFPAVDPTVLLDTPNPPSPQVPEGAVPHRRPHSAARHPHTGLLQCQGHVRDAGHERCTIVYDLEILHNKNLNLENKKIKFILINHQ